MGKGQAGQCDTDSPTVRMFNSQAAFCSDCSQSPFVISVKDGQPLIRVVKEGTTIQMQPLAFEDRIKLNFRVEFSRILGVETARLPMAANHSGDSVMARVPPATTLCPAS